MKLIRKVFLISIFSFFSFSIFAQQQAVQKASDVEEVETETSVENEYLNEKNQENQRMAGRSVQRP